ncbi:MAG: hypothetical protein H6Q17_520 [Bacteroidetes bacterium]|nr:hypothetical protein [Bacteroidota bacterium]
MLHIQYNTRICLTTLFSVLFCALVFSQNGDTIAIQRNGSSHKINFIQFQLKQKSDRHISNGKQFLLKTLHAKSDDNLQLIKSDADQDGHTHQRYQQFYKGIKVEGGEYLTHSKDEYIYTINGHFADITISSTTPQIDSITALAFATKALNAKKYNWSTKADKYYPKAFLVICKEPTKESFHLAWKFTLIASEPMLAEDIYVDANTGNIINRISLIQDNNIQGTATTKYSGDQTITADSFSSGYRLRETQNNVNIQTQSFNHNQYPTNTSIASDFVNNNSNWTSSSWTNFTNDRPALDAHWGAEQVYSYWHTVFGRNSIDNNGLTIKSYVHLGTGYDNAFWYSPTLSMYYGDGSILFKPLTALDVCAHEFGHGICQYTANLAYQGESGALNEGFSDIWGACVEYWAAPNKQTWLIGEDITLNQTALRSLSNPKQFAQPDTYGGTYWYSQNGCSPSLDNDYCGVHANSGVLNKWFYLLSQGGSGTNDKGNSYSVTGIGINDAQIIAYRAERDYLFSSATYQDAYNATIQAAADAFGSNSTQLSSVISAWYAVGVTGSSYIVSASINGDDMVSPGSTHTYTCSPSNSNYTYEWYIDENNTSRDTQFINGNTNTITFNGDGIFDLYCNIYAGSGLMLGSGFIEILCSSGYYNVSNTITGTLTVQLKNTAPTIENQTVSYELSSLQNSSTKQQGSFDQGGTNLNVSAMPKGVYAIKIKIKAGVEEIHKVILK